MSMSLDPNVAAALCVDIPEESLGPATRGFACNCLVSGACPVIRWVVGREVGEAKKTYDGGLKKLGGSFKKERCT